jgi:hypothetical protein
MVRSDLKSIIRDGTSSTVTKKASAVCVFVPVIYVIIARACTVDHDVTTCVAVVTGRPSRTSKICWRPCSH